MFSSFIMDIVDSMPAHTATAGASNSNVTVIAPVVGVPLVQDAVVVPSQGYSEVGVSLDDRNNAWRLEHKGKSSSLDPSYLDKSSASFRVTRKCI